MASSTETLIFEIIAKDAAASAAFARFRSQVDGTSKSVDKSSASLDKNSKALDQNKEHTTSALGTLVGMGTAFAPITAGAAAAGLGFGAFAALAVPSVMKVTAALSAKGGGLAAQWETLDNRQRVAALGVQDLMNRYTGLTRAMEPQVFQVFNTALGLANSLLGPTAKLAQNAGQGIESFLVQFSQRAGLQQFITDMAGIAGPSFSLLGDDITHIAHAVFQLLQAFSGTGLVELQLLSGVFTALDDSITFLSQHAPGLTSVALSIGGVALALSKVGALGNVLKITGLASIAGQMEGFAAATEGATLAEKGLLATTTVLDAVSPLGWAVLAAASLAGLVVVLSRFKSGTDATIASIEKQNDAQGFNTAGYVAAATAVGAYAKANAGASENLVNLHTGMVTGTTDAGQLSGATTALTAAQRKLVTDGANQTTFLDMLESRYGLTRDAAISLAEHSGVLASQVDKGGQAMKDATAKADAYANSNLLAQGPTSQLAKDMSDFANNTLTATARTTALTNALKLFFDPAVSADQDTITLANDQVALAAALHASGGKTGLLTQAQRDARSAFDTYISQVAQAAQSAFSATGKTSSYTSVIDHALPALAAAAGGNKTLRQEILNLIATEKGIKSETVHITVQGDGSYFIKNSGGVGHGLVPGSVPGQAAGGLITGGIPGRDSVLGLLMPGELVVPVKDVNEGAVDHLRGRLPGFAAGGVVGSYHDGIGGLPKWLASENTATIRVIEAATAAATTAAIKAAQVGPASGGGHVKFVPGGGTKQWEPVVLSALSQLGLSSGLVLDVLYQMLTESGGNPNAVNLTDSNAAAGHPSVGLMQVIRGTFDAYAGKYVGTGPFAYGVSENPMANIYAALNYGKHNGRGFGTGPGQIGSGHGYAAGTGGAAAGWAKVGEQGTELVRFHGGEEVLPASMTSRILSGMAGMPGYAAGTKPTAQQAKWLAELAADVARRDKLAKARTTSDHARQLAVTAVELLALQHPASKADAKKLAAMRKALGSWEATTLAPISLLNKEITLLRTLTGNPSALKYGGPGPAPVTPPDATDTGSTDPGTTAAAPAGPAPGTPVLAVTGGSVAPVLPGASPWSGAAALPPRPQSWYGGGPVAGPFAGAAPRPGRGYGGGDAGPGNAELLAELKALRQGLAAVEAAVGKVAPGVAQGVNRGLNGLARGVVST